MQIYNCDEINEISFDSIFAGETVVLISHNYRLGLSDWDTELIETSQKDTGIITFTEIGSLAWFLLYRL
jgi:hypothetical protein